MPVVESSAVRRIEYDAPSRTLFVIFQSGERYAYLDAPPDVFAAFLDAGSKGRFFQDQVRGRFHFHRLI